MLHAFIIMMPGCAFCLCTGKEGTAVSEFELHMPAGLFVGLAGRSQVGPAQPSAFSVPSSSANFTLGAASNYGHPFLPDPKMLH